MFREPMILLKARLKAEHSILLIIFAVVLNSSNFVGQKLALAEPVAKLLSCSVPENVAWSYGSTPKFAQAISRHQRVTIMALGSSSTVGIGASEKSKSFLSRFELELRQRFEDVKISIMNSGKSGETATQMVQRLRPEIAKRTPDLVLWQTGVNDAIQGDDLGVFESSLLRGIRFLQSQNIDVVFIEPQDFPGAAKVRNYEAYLNVLKRVATHAHVSRLKRYGIMQHLAAQSRNGLKDLLATDEFHMNDVSHACVGRLLADGLAELTAKSITKAKQHH
jgi:acyl-CoA thioesterase-1